MSLLTFVFSERAGVCLHTPAISPDYQTTPVIQHLILIPNKTTRLDLPELLVEIALVRE